MKGTDMRRVDQSNPNPPPKKMQKKGESANGHKQTNNARTHIHPPTASISSISARMKVSASPFPPSHAAIVSSSPSRSSSIPTSCSVERYPRLVGSTAATAAATGCAARAGAKAAAAAVAALPFPLPPACGSAAGGVVDVDGVGVSSCLARVSHESSTSIVSRSSCRSCRESCPSMSSTVRAGHWLGFLGRRGGVGGMKLLSLFRLVG